MANILLVFWFPWIIATRALWSQEQCRVESSREGSYGKWHSMYIPNWWYPMNTFPDNREFVLQFCAVLYNFPSIKLWLIFSCITGPSLYLHNEGTQASQKFWGLFSEVLGIYTKLLPQRSHNYPNHHFKPPQKGCLLSVAALRQPFCIYSESFWEEASALLRSLCTFVV